MLAALDRVSAEQIRKAEINTLNGEVTGGRHLGHCRRRAGQITLEIAVIGHVDALAAIQRVVTLAACEQPEGYVSDAADCDGSYDYFFGGGLDPSVLAGTENPFYLKPNTGVSFGNPYQAARTIRLGLKFLW